MMNVVQLIAGLVLLYIGGEALVSSAGKLARRLGMSPLTMGLTVVAFGTSAPELAASLTAALGQAPEIAFGNVIGSNIANLGLVLGIGVLLLPLRTSTRFLKREVPFLVTSTILAMALTRNGVLGRGEGAALVGLLGLYLFYSWRRRSPNPQGGSPNSQETTPRSGGIVMHLAGVALGVALLVVGAKLLIAGAVAIARLLGVGERVIGLTLVALGTSLPEMASTVIAALKREGDMVLGNLVGSNIFNLLFVLGATALIVPLRIEALSAELDLAVMIGFTILIWPLMATGRKLQRWEGGLLLLLYLVYVAWLFVRP